MALRSQGRGGNSIHGICLLRGRYVPWTTGDRAVLLLSLGSEDQMSLKIAIAGAGVGGLACATGLAQAGHEVRIFDQFDAPSPVGSGLVIQPVGLRALRAIGAEAVALSLGNPVTRMLGHEVEQGRRVLDVCYDAGSEDGFGLAIHRASLFQALYDAAQAVGVEICPGHKVSGWDNGQLHFANGQSVAGFDLVVDASGVGSPLSPLVAKPLPYGALWATVDWPEGSGLPRNELRQAYRRANRMLGVLPIGRMPGSDQAKAAIFWSLPANGFTAWQERGLEAWKSEAAALWPEFMPFLSQITDPAQMTMARYTHGTLKRPYAPGLVFLGDAAHRASPQLGQGANMALLDAQALCLALERSRGDVALALRWYAQARRGHVRVYQIMSRMFTPQYQSDSELLPVLRDRLLFPLSRIAPIPAVLTRLVSGTMLPPLGSLE